jgi:16S rRNA (guanine(966)-N(2))-methyltransferase RsmD
MENRRPSTPHKGSGPKRYDTPNRRGPGGYQRDDQRGPSSGPRRGPGGGPNRYGNDSRSFYGKPAGKFQGRPGEKRKPKPWEERPRVPITSDFQITDGKFQGKMLLSSASPRMCATKSRLREFLFKMISRKIRAGRFLDICAGSGMVGFEAISRGAMLVSFVERSAKMCSWIKKNVDLVGLKPGHTEVFESEVLPFLKKISERRRFWEVVYFCPPDDGTAPEMLKLLGRGVTIAPGGLLIIEHPPEMEMADNLGILRKSRTIKQEAGSLTLYDRRASTMK